MCLLLAGVTLRKANLDLAAGGGGAVDRSCDITCSSGGSIVLVLVSMWEVPRKPKRLKEENGRTGKAQKSYAEPTGSKIFRDSVVSIYNFVHRSIFRRACFTRTTY